jgi:hypothetical protein
MYKCEICHKVIPANVKSYRIPVETRPKAYPVRKDANRIIREGKVSYTDDPGGIGYEVVREVTACPTCAAQMKD